jgi:hypothetical protein
MKYAQGKDKFIETLDTLGSSGVNKSIAQVQALLLISPNQEKCN